MLVIAGGYLGSVAEQEKTLKHKRSIRDLVVKNAVVQTGTLDSLSNCLQAIDCLFLEGCDFANNLVIDPSNSTNKENKLVDICVPNHSLRAIAIINKTDKIDHGAMYLSIEATQY